MNSLLSIKLLPFSYYNSTREDFLINLSSIIDRISVNNNNEYKEFNTKFSIGVLLKIILSCHINTINH